MLYGSKEQRELAIREAKYFADCMGVTLIFGSMVNSISKGVHYCSSDYDTRFLYIRKDFPEKICSPAEMTKRELLQRYHPSDPMFDWIIFEESTSFLQFLLEPHCKNGWYYLVGWTLMSPYRWDPYGLQGKLIPLMNQIFDINYEIVYYKNEIHKCRKELEMPEVSAKHYLNSIHAAATIEWCFQHQEHPPVDLQTLLYGLGRYSIWTETANILEQARKVAREEFALRETRLRLKKFRLAPMTFHHPLLVEYIDEILQKIASSNLESMKKTGTKHSEMIMQNMYDVIYRSIFHQEAIL